METGKLKRFAAEARVNLMDGVRRKLCLLGFDESGRVIGKAPEWTQGATLWNGEEYPESFYQQWTALRDRLGERGVREVVEEAAYTWFNRMMAIRILTMNGLCEPVLRLDPATGLPLLLADARMGRIPEMTYQERARFDKLMDDDNRTYDQFALLLTVWCHANPIISSCFGSINDYVELLLPDNILRPDGFLTKLNDTPFITDEDYKSAELIGWLYQFYISDRKDEVFAKKGKVEADEIPAATQIFTPNWIVKYMVENTILPQVEADDEILEHAKYLVKTESRSAPKVELEDLKVADFACGSGHILNECFDLLFSLYRAESYSRREAIECIFTKNLTGIDIDLRAKQLATFALLLKACQKDSSFADAHCMPHVITVPEIEDELFDLEDPQTISGYLHHFFLGSETKECSGQLTSAIVLLKDADSLGSIIKFDISPSTRRQLVEAVAHWENQTEKPEAVKEGLPFMDFILTLTDNYDAIVMNPPYMKSGSFNDVISLYVAGNGKKGKNAIEAHYPDTKADLFSVFMDVCNDRLKDGGKYGMINMQSWMFLTNFEDLRKKIISPQPILDKTGNKTGEFTSLQHIDSLLHLGPRTFDELSGEVVQNVAFVIAKDKLTSPGIYFRLIDGRSCNAKRDMFLKGEYQYVVADQKQFEKIPETILGYWMSSKVIDLYDEKQLSEYANLRSGISTGDNDRFYRLWYECNSLRIAPKSDFQPQTSKYKWFKIIRGGGGRKWYGNRDNVINLENDCSEIRNSGLNHRLRTSSYYNKKGITWSRIASENLAFRIKSEDVNFGENSPCFFLTTSNVSMPYILGLLNTKLIKFVLGSVNPTLSFQIADIVKAPIKVTENETLSKIVSECISICKADWDAHETSWDFQTNPLVFSILDNGWGTLEDSVADYEQVWEHKFRKLHANEEELNRQFIEIYGLKDELTPDVPLDEITILQQGEVKIEDSELKWQRNVIIQQLISYMVGCYMGRYRLDRVDEKGLHIAHPEPSEEELAPYKVSFTHDATFTVDSDGIIPVLPQGAPFYDNLYNYVEQFVKMVWGEEDLQENMNFIEKCLGKPLNDYLMKDFWKYHNLSFASSTC